MTRVMVLGGSGMLGSMVVDVLSGVGDCELTATVRDGSAAIASKYPGVTWRTMDVTRPDPAVFRDQDWIINAIGITKPLVKDDNAEQVERAIRVNAQFPHDLGQFVMESGARVLQIATDCVYSGIRGGYTESDTHDAWDVYGKTKSLGETYQPGVKHLRCSIIGPEPKDYKFLIEWFRRQPPRATLKGFTNHSWNGVTTLHFARLCRGAIATNMELPHLLHVIPSGMITKAEMLHEFARAFAREDLRIEDVEAATTIDRTLATNNPTLNDAVWRAAGYSTPPTVPEMIRELAAYPYRATAGAAA